MTSHYEPCYCSRCDGRLPAPCVYGTDRATRRKPATPALAILTVSDGQQCFYAVPIGTHWIIPIPRWWLRAKSWMPNKRRGLS